ncbi:hypothetical protein EBZ37_11505, partial [bacterium]|nr:hypothetical protein [bacterium]
MKIKFLCLSILLLCGAAWASPWGQNMQSLFQSLQELLVLTGDDSRYQDPKNTARIESAAEALAKSAHSVAVMTEKSPDADPSIGIFGSILQDEARRGLEAFKSGHREYARGIFKNLASTCVACHSRSAAGLRLQWNFSSGFAQGLSQFQQAELLAAGRSFDSALTALEKVIADGDAAKKRPSEWNRALRFALAISVRVERNPSRGLALLEKALNTPGIPQFSKLDIQDWKRALQTWKREKDGKKTEF